MATKNSKKVSQKTILTKLQEATDMKIKHIDNVDMQLSIGLLKQQTNSTQVQNNKQALKAATVLNKIKKIAEADGYSNDAIGNFDNPPKNYDEMTETDKTFAAMDALIEQDPLDDDEEIITAQEVLDGANGINNTPEPKGEGGATAEDIKQNILNELQKTTDQTPALVKTTPTTQPSKEEDKKETGINAFFKKYKTYILVALAAIGIYLIFSKNN